MRGELREEPYEKCDSRQSLVISRWSLALVVGRESLVVGNDEWPSVAVE